LKIEDPSGPKVLIFRVKGVAVAYRGHGSTKPFGRERTEEERTADGNELGNHGSLEKHHGDQLAI
jgi:hypothetical protein